MNPDFVLLCMFFCHVVDDYYLQGILASMKQKSWWKEHAPQRLYELDYILALFIHGFSWSFMIMLPLAVYNHFEVNMFYCAFLLGNAVVHAVVDDLKANKGVISLWTDQVIHFAQIMLTFGLCI